MKRTTTLNFKVHLDEKNLPEKIEWSADDAGFSGFKESKTLFLSLWDKEEKLTMGIDLWTKDMFVDDMNIHIHQILNKLAETCREATSSSEAADLIKGFSADFAEKLNLIKNVKKR